MSTNEVSNNEAAESTNVANAAMKLEVVIIPVSDVDRAMEFYAKLGWRLDVDRAAGNAFRLVQFTPPGSGSSIQFGVNLTSAAPGSAQGILLAVTDIEAGAPATRSAGRGCKQRLSLRNGDCLQVSGHRRASEWGTAGAP
jgi:predicted enzyme related to lactoylglutathione lyase